MNLIEISLEEKEEILQNFINCFKEEKGKEGRKFENFLGFLLPQFGFEEVCVTQHSRDGGIDLTAIRKGFDIKGSDNQNFYIQAKCYALENVVCAPAINELRGSVKKDKTGTVLTGCINIFITTSKFTRDAIKVAEEDIHRPVILIDGLMLMDMCIQKGIGFDFKAIFDPDGIRKLISPTQKETPAASSLETYDVTRIVTLNDVRARILPLPQLVKNILNDKQAYLDLTINGKAYQLTIDKSQRYLAGVTELYRGLGMIKSDGILESRTGKWVIKESKVFLTIE